MDRYKIKKGIFNKSTITIVVTFLILGSVYSGVVLYRKSLANKTQAELLHVTGAQEEPTEITGEKFYQITLSSSPYRRSDDDRLGDIMLEVNLKNLNITPFITNLGTDKCILSDKLGRQYQADLISEVPLKKALLTGEEVSVKIDGALYINVLQEGETSCQKEGSGVIDWVHNNDWVKNAVKCVYSPSGECTCEDIGPLSVNECTFRVTSDGKQASNGWGQYPLVVPIQN